MFLSAAVPDNEVRRLERLRALAVLDTPPEPIFDSLVKVAADICNVPIALMSLVDADRQWFKSAIGLGGVAETSRDVAFCAHVVFDGQLLEVPDATRDERFADNPLVTGPSDFQFYCGAPIVLSDGFTLGTLCVLDRVPRRLDADQRRTLRQLARTVAEALEFREKAQRAVEDADRANATMANLYRSTPAPMFSMDTKGTLLVVSDTWLSETGYTRDEVVGRSVFELLTPASRAFALTIGMPTFLDIGRTQNHEYQVVHKDGSLMDVLVSQTLERDGSGKPLRSMSVFENITLRRRAEEDLRGSRELLQVTLDSIGDAVITTDNASLVQWLNPVAERMTGWPKAEAAGRPLAEVFVIVDEASGLPTRDPVAACLDEARTVGVAGHVTLVSRNGIAYGIEDSASPIRHGDGRVHGAVLVFRDVSEQRRLHHEMSHRATHDVLTGLLNRGEFESRLARLLDSGAANGALLYIDLDQFKLVNDACGHGAGDQLLKQVASIVRGCVRGQDALARLGGDEFGVVLEHCEVGHAQRVAQKICDQMDAFRFVHEGRRFRVGTSIGLVPIDARWTGIKVLLQAADASCYAAKDEGRNRVHTWYDSDQVVEARHGEMQWVTRLEAALDENRFELFGQRIEAIGAASRGLHFEVLLRKRERNGNLVPPGAFLPAAERFHLATRIDRWVVRNAFEWLRIAADDGIDIEMMSVNLSGQSLGDRAFHRDVVQMIRCASFDPRRLCFEITETAAITHLAEARAFIDEVRTLGVGIALDDFGAGASSFGYLKSLPVDYLKIDGHFITNLLEDALDNAAVRCFCDVAKVVGVKTIAEFVERDDVRDALAALGVDMAQGYLIHRPEPLRTLLAPVPA